MVQLIYKYDKCSECSHEGFQWGVVIEFKTVKLNEQKQYQTITDHIFICRDCIKIVLQKLDDMIDEADRKTALKLIKGILDSSKGARH